jgi:hypothetical protein
MNFICSDIFVLIVEDKEAERYKDGDPEKEIMAGRVDSLSSVSEERLRYDVVKR